MSISQSRASVTIMQGSLEKNELLVQLHLIFILAGLPVHLAAFLPFFPFFLLFFLS